MKAGIELDALVDEKIFGDRHEIVCRQHGHLLSENGPQEACTQLLGRFSFDGTCPKCGWSGWISNKPRPYSTDIRAAWDVLDKLQEAALVNVRLYSFINKDYINQKWVIVGKEWTASVFYSHGGGDNAGPVVDAETAPLAICLVALKTLGVLESNEGPRS